MDPLKIEINKGVSYRDTSRTWDNILTTIGNKIGETFNNTSKYPAVISTGELDPSEGVITAEAIKLSTPVKLQLLDEVTGSVVFDGSETEKPGINLYTKVTEILNKKITDSFRVEENILYCNNAYNLGYVGTDKKNKGKILNKNLSDVFEIPKADDTGLHIKKSTTARYFEDVKLIKITGSVAGEVETDFSGDVTINVTGQTQEIDNVELKNWYFKYTNDLAEHPISELNEQRINAVEYFSVTVQNTNIKSNSNIFVLPPKNISKKDLLKLERLNLQEGSQTNGSVTLRAFSPEKPSDGIKIRLMIYGVNY